MKFTNIETGLFFMVSKNMYRVPDDIQIGNYKISCQIRYDGSSYVSHQNYIILLKPKYLYIGPNEIRLNEKISCYPYNHIVPKTVTQIKVDVKWKVSFDDDISEYINFTPYIQEGHYAKIKEEGAFGSYEGNCKVTVQIFSHVYNLEAIFNFKVTGFSKSIALETRHSVPVFFFVYVTVMVFVSHYVFCILCAYERTQRKIRDIELKAILESIQIDRRVKKKWTHKTYYFGPNALPKYIYLQIIQLIKEKKRDFINTVGKALEFDQSFLNALAVTQPIETHLVRTMTGEPLIPNVTYFVRALSRGSMQFPKNPTPENIYTILAQKVLDDETIKVTNIAKLKSQLYQPGTSIFNRTYDSKPVEITILLSKARRLTEKMEPSMLPRQRRPTGPIHVQLQHL